MNGRGMIIAALATAWLGVGAAAALAQPPTRVAPKDPKATPPQTQMQCPYGCTHCARMNKQMMKGRMGRPMLQPGARARGMRMGRMMAGHRGMMSHHDRERLRRERRLRNDAFSRRPMRLMMMREGMPGPMAGAPDVRTRRWSVTRQGPRGIERRVEIREMRPGMGSERGMRAERFGGGDMWQGRGGARRHAHGEGMWQGLKLTDEQRDQIQALRYQQQQDMIDLRAKLQKARLELRHAMRDGKVSEEDMDHMIDAIAQQRAEIAKRRLQTHMKMRALLTDEQRKMLDQRRSGRGGGRSTSGDDNPR